MPAVPLNSSLGLLPVQEAASSAQTSPPSSWRLGSLAFLSTPKDSVSNQQPDRLPISEKQSPSHGFFLRQNPYLRLAQSVLARAKNQEDYIRAVIWVSMYQWDQKNQPSSSETVRLFNDRFAKRTSRLALARIKDQVIRNSLQKELSSPCPWCAPGFHPHLPVLSLSRHETQQLNELGFKPWLVWNENQKSLNFLDFVRHVLHENTQNSG